MNPGYLSQIENGTRVPSQRVVTALSEALGVHVVAPAAVKPEPVPTCVSSETPGILTGILAGQRRLEDVTGSAPLVGPTLAQLGVIAGMLHDARGPVRRELLHIAAQWAVFTGWLCTATGRHGSAVRAFNLAADWAQEAGDDTLISHVYAFKGYSSRRRGDLAAMEGLTAAARRLKIVHPAQRAYNAFQHARALARLDDRRSAVTLLDLAIRESDAAMREGRPPEYGYWYTPAFFKLSVGLTHVWLGSHDEAQDLITAGLAELPDDQRGSEWADEFRAALAG
jgi:transcriptional regulator with XRE-family HTH domain